MIGMLLMILGLCLAVFFAIFKFVVSEMGLFIKLIGIAVLLILLYAVGAMLLGAADLAVLFAST